jgi:hypothetical protein
LSVNSVDRSLDGNASVKRGYAGGRSTSARGQNVAYRDILDELGVEVGFLVDGAKDM